VCPACDCGPLPHATYRQGGPGGRGVTAEIDVPSANISDVVEPANTGSVACLLKAGFRLADPEPDADGVVYYLHQRG
jgi:hypothetical protein